MLFILILPWTKLKSLLQQFNNIFFKKNPTHIRRILVSIILYILYITIYNGKFYVNVLSNLFKPSSTFRHKHLPYKYAHLTQTAIGNWFRISAAKNHRYILSNKAHVKKPIISRVREIG